jgi:asparagine synthase (glutamine-hydrolysing)
MSTRDLLLSQAARERGLFEPARVDALIEDHRAGRAQNGFRLWTLLCLEMWFREVACRA